MLFKTYIERLAWETTREQKLALIKAVQGRHGNYVFKRYLKKIVKAVKRRIEK